MCSERGLTGRVGGSNRRMLSLAETLALAVDTPLGLSLPGEATEGIVPVDE